ncbi:MAG: hypothetical protein EXX96DRAFT_617849 [Benjaminiella poitrasii]|nr:MAG: hypothetical protein EXX96DRAFT_617849 [Benjaminiella poitrasii]
MINLSIVNETILPHNNPELQLSIQDLVYPTETAETLLETLSSEQLSIIEQAINKTKERKLLLLKKDVTNESSEGKSVLEIRNSTLVNTDSPPEDTSNNIIKQQSTSNDDSKEKSLQQQQRNIKAKPHTATNSHASISSFLATSHEPTTEIKEGVEWVSFVYSHHRVLRRYCIRTDLEKVDTSILDEKFKKENCVYPRANLPKESYQGNRWGYETECNVLGWKLAYLNPDEIAGKRGLIQRAVDSYRNRYPSMRSRRVARQEKLLKGTLRKRKHREMVGNEDESCHKMAKSNHHEQTFEKIPKTILVEDPVGSTAPTKCRIRINIDSVVLDAVDITFRKNNCVFPRAIHITPDNPNVSQRRRDEARCNEIGWKLAWLNPRQLANKRSLLQRVLDVYRKQFTSELKPRKYASRTPPTPPSVSSPEVIKTEEQQEINTQIIPLTEEALANQQKQLSESESVSSTMKRCDSIAGQSCYSGTTVTLDFHDYCFSPPPEDGDDDMDIMVSCCHEDTMQEMSATATNSPLLHSTNSQMLNGLIFNVTDTSPENSVLIPSDLLNNNNRSNSNDEGSSNNETIIEHHNIYQPSFLIESNNTTIDITVKNEHVTTQQQSVMDVMFEDHAPSKELMFVANNNVSSQETIINLMTTTYGGSNAGINDFVNNKMIESDPSLLNQLF